MNGTLSARLLSVERLTRKAAKRLAALAGRKQVYVGSRTDQYRRLWRAVAKQLNADFVELSEEAWEIRQGSRSVRLLGYLLPLDNPVVLDLAVNKPLVHRLLADAGLTVPAHLSYTLAELARAQEFLREHPRGCAVKPAASYGGQGITTHVRDAKGVRRASVLASLYGSELLIEEMVLGESYRMLVFAGEVLQVRRRTGIRVTADGRTPLHTLLDEAGVSLDGDCAFTLGAQRLDPQSTPAAGSLLVRAVPKHASAGEELRTVYDTTLSLDEVHPSVLEQARKAARVVRSELLGVDVITPDISRPLAEVGGTLNEVNTTPAMHHHYDSTREDFPEPALQIVSALLARESTS